MPRSVVDAAREFLEQKRIAVVGVSRHPRDFSRAVFRALAERGYDVVPVNPAATEIEGRRAFARVADVAPPVGAALLLTAPARTEAAVRDCMAAGVRRVWMHRGGGPGAATPEALALCAANGLDVVHDLCPFMMLPDAGLGHRLHGYFRRRRLSRAAAASTR
jgi:predicted CoA-binding protein